MADSNNVTSSSIALLPGMVATLEVKNTFAHSGPMLHNDVSRTLINGFLSEDETIGTVSPVSGIEGTIVEYKHLKSLSNKVWFYGRCGEIGLFTVVYVPIHDHATLVTGGPAFATYASEPREEGS